MLRSTLRFLGLNIHAGWEKTHRSGFELRCRGCGERRSKYTYGSAKMTRNIEWWQTTGSGDGSCGRVQELPARLPDVKA